MATFTFHFRQSNCFILCHDPLDGNPGCEPKGFAIILLEKFFGGLQT